MRNRTILPATIPNEFSLLCCSLLARVLLLHPGRCHGELPRSVQSGVFFICKLYLPSFVSFNTDIIISDSQFGRGGETNYHIGNHRFRVLADEHRSRYRGSTRKEKAAVVQDVVRIWRSRNGRFLTKTDPTKGDDSTWHDVGDEVRQAVGSLEVQPTVPRSDMSLQFAHS